ncbi:uncharacterized protein EDB93DRAFT_1244367 [Suillus bovinus]|uniref:uncharacterized protein n=1 Tax=Suillus bovinus TaxID=48563 RepID=UPI001B85FC98|nr:uncharacterized protein EDB93DRAFT_1244367 [Suillus bovinus]KAG2159575.1 hypothetical protein EDB93DRAFT_1244367 [Suillus bovinus]
MDGPPPSHTVNKILKITITDPSSLPSVYLLLNDDSRLSFFDDLETTYLALVTMASLFTIFARNIILSVAFLWSGRVRKKALLYTLFLSQLLAPVSILSLLIAQFHPHFDCKIIMRISVATAGLSFSLLISGIIGVKAYRCLNNSRLVLVVLVALRTAAIVLLALDLASLNSRRSLSGASSDSHYPHFHLHFYFKKTQAAAIDHLIPSHMVSQYSYLSNRCSSVFVVSQAHYITPTRLIITVLYAVWKSRGSTAVQGRITVSLSLDDVADPHQDTRKESIESHKTTHSRRGWWDYVPTTDHIAPFPPRSRRTQSLPRDPSIPMSCLSKFRTGERVRDPENVPSIPPIPPLPTESPLARTSAIRVSTTIPNTRNDPPIPRRSSSPAISVHKSHESIYASCSVPYVSIQLLYTTFIAASTAASAIMTIVSVNSANPADHVAWMAFDWALVSCLVVHSFSRVIRRHENEALLQQPSVWHRNLRTDRNLLAEGRARSSRSSFTRSFQVRTRRYPMSRRHDGEAPRDPSRSPRGDPNSNAFSPHQVETRLHAILPPHPPTPEADCFPDDISSCHRSDTKLTESVFLGHRYHDSLPSLPPRPVLEDQR